MEKFDRMIAGRIFLMELSRPLARLIWKRCTAFEDCFAEEHTYYRKPVQPTAKLPWVCHISNDASFFWNGEWYFSGEKGRGRRNGGAEKNGGNVPVNQLLYKKRQNHFLWVWLQISVTIAAVFIWIGFVGAISFMEAWLIQAPGITCHSDLVSDVWCLVHSIKVELVLSITIVLSMLFSGIKGFGKTHVFPSCDCHYSEHGFTLDVHAEMHIQGQEVSHSSLHFYYGMKS